MGNGKVEMDSLAQSICSLDRLSIVRRDRVYYRFGSGIRFNLAAVGVLVPVYRIHLSNGDMLAYDPVQGDTRRYRYRKRTERKVVQ